MSKRLSKQFSKRMRSQLGAKSIVGKGLTMTDQTIEVEPQIQLGIAHLKVDRERQMCSEQAFCAHETPQKEVSESNYTAILTEIVFERARDRTKIVLLGGCHTFAVVLH